MGGLDDVLLNEQVLGDEVRRVGIVGEDAAHFSGRQEDVLRPFLLEEGEGSLLIPEVRLLAGAQQEVLIAIF
ncbi:hypothetical protein D3C86_1464560 [compost metagenome]